MTENFREGMFPVVWRELIVPLGDVWRTMPRSRRPALALASLCFVASGAGLGAAWYTSDHGPEDPSSTKPKIVAAVAANHHEVHRDITFAGHAAEAGVGVFLLTTMLPELPAIRLGRRSEEFQIETPPEILVPEV